MKTKSTILLLVLFCITNIVYSQTVVCEGSSCTANDYTLDHFFLGDENGVPFGPGYCEPGTTVNAHIWTNFVANSAANRYTLYLHFNLYVDNVFVSTIDECYYEGQPIPTNVTLDVYNFNWECGSEIALRDFYMSWRPNANQACGCSNSKCYQESEIIVQAPLIANFEFNPSCLSAYTLNFNSTTSGGAPPYTYYWEFGDGDSSTEANPTHTYTSTGPYTVTLTVQDTENTDSYEFEIVNFNPNLPPEIYPPANSNIEGCSIIDLPSFPYSETPVDITETEFNTAGGTLVLSSNIVTLTYVDSSSGMCPTTIIRTFTVTDTCLNTANDTQTIIINDTTLPTASNPIPISVQCINDVPAANISVITDATDNCSTPTVAFVSETSNNGTCPETIIRTYSVTDACGNSISLDQIITINDDIAPTATNPASITVQCNGDVPAVDTAIITDASDNCSVPTVSFVSETTDNNNCPITITRTYSVVDDCGNVIFLTHNITIDDTTPPSAIGPGDITVQCTSEIPSPNIADVTSVSDNCSSPIVTFVSDVSNTGACPEIITRTYSVIDDCGNEIFLTQDITIQDDTLPTASTPAPINVQCIGDVPPPDISVISDATDNCSNPVVSFISDVSTGQCPQLIVRTYRIQDGCGNTIDIIQTINVNDDVLPTASNLNPILISCSDPIPNPDISLITDEADNCSIPTVAFVSDASNGMCPETITRTYSVTDECGNSIFVTQDIISNDIIAPTISAPLVDATVDCDAIPPPPNVTFSDNCSSTLDIVFNETDTNMNNTVDYVITRTWTVTDSCGNQSVFTQTLDVLIANCLVSQCNSCGPVDDTIPPTASDPADIDVPCDAAIPAPDPSVVIDEADNCVPPVVAFVSETVSVDCLERIIRTYSVTDECGNVIYVNHTINVVDLILPTASDPADINVSCTDNIPAPDVNVVTDEADNCSIPEVTFVSDVSNNACNERIIRTYRVTDNCGNFVDVQQHINVLDNVAPSANTLSDINLACINAVPIPDTNLISATDNCSTPTVNFISDISDNNICPETITRTYRVTDECGNFVDILQNIVILDDIDPTASNPQSILVSCIGDVPNPNINVVTDEADNCSTPTVAYVSDTSDNLSCPETITRIYSVTDICGNSINVSQTIIVNDIIPPTASNPVTFEFSQSADVPTPDVNVVTDEADNCSIPTVTFTSEASDNQTCPETITRIYTVTDACGNTVDVTQLIIINDTVSPTATGPNPISVQCITDVPNPDISIVTNVSDNNGTATVAFVSESSSNQTCPEIITRIYSVTDTCGNAINVSHVIVVDDDIPPTASNPQTLTFTDANQVPAPDPEVVIDEADNCSVPNVAFVSEVSNNDTCQMIITRTYSVTDACGNAINVSQDIIVNDETAPTASVPNAITLSCEDAVPAADTSVITDATDDTSTVSIFFISEVSNNQTCPEIIDRIYRVIDDCGNYVDITHQIIIDDIILPTATNPSPLFLDTISDVPNQDPEVVIDEADNCSIPTVSFVSENSSNSGCGILITRIYSVTDACDNTIRVTHEITVNDSEAPFASNPQPSTYNCSEDIPIPNINVVTDASDNSSTPTVTFVSESSDTQDCTITITRIYNVADDCSNSIDVTHMIYVQDTTAPTLTSTIENELTIICGIIPQVPSIEYLDNCTDNVIVLYDEEYIDIDSDNYDIIRTWTALDDCDNESNVSQTIHMRNSNEFYSNDIERCLTDTPIDLMTFITDDTGTWESEHLNLLDGTTFNPATSEEGDYLFTYTTFNNDCSRINEVKINVNDNCIEYPCIRSRQDISISKLVTPNGDLKNETFNVSYIPNTDVDDFSRCAIQVSVKMFNRWGTKVFESNDYNNDWDGNAPSSSLGSAIKLPAGTYYYIVELINSDIKPIQGFILLGTNQ